MHQEWVAEMVQRGVWVTSHHNHFINASLTESDIAKTLEIADEAFGIVAKRHGVTA
jgi:glutamate-1-semialdehyde 2,1-aminomutase